MVLDAVVERFLEHSPISVMARLGLQRALDPAWIDELFEQERETQYTRELFVLDDGGNHVAGRRGAAPVGACGSQGQSGAAGFHHRAVRQAQPDRAGAGSCPGARQCAAVGVGRATDVAQAAAIGE